MKKALKAIVRSLGYEITAVPKPPRQAFFDEAPVHDYEALRTFVTRAATFAGSPDHLQSVRKLYLTGLLRERPYAAQSRIEIGDHKTLEVGIWRRQRPGEDAPFIRRSDRGHDWFYWANNDRIEQKRRKWRVALLGESVARGYLFDPHFNPAAALRTILQSQLGSENIDVVDLAKSNQTMEELKSAIGQSLALSPDVVVIFAGNNWRTHLAEEDIPFAESILRKHGAPGVKRLLDEKREHAVRNLISQATSILIPRQVKIVWIIPEFNLGDWADPASGPPLLVGQGNRQWLELDRQVKQAFDEGDIALACRLATAMTELDEGTSAVPLQALANCCRSTEDLAGTRRYLELSRDAEGWDPSFSLSPRTCSSVQSALRGAASLPGNAVVDLPDLFAKHVAALPDRRMFLDYCHLTAEGIVLAAAAAASKVVQFLNGQTVSLEILQRKCPPLPAKIEGKACFLAAVHNAHFYQRADIVRHWCDRAIHCWPECASLMTRFVDYQTRGLSVAMCKSGLELLSQDELDTARYLARGRAQRIDLTLCEAVIGSVASIGLSIGDDIECLRSRVHALGSRPTDLTEFYYSSAIPGLSERGWTSSCFPTNRGSRRAYTSALWETSRFIFIAEKGKAAIVALTYRVPAASATGETVTLYLNGHHVADLPAAVTWRAHQISLPDPYIVTGVNELTIAWPILDSSPQNRLDDAADRLLARQLPVLFRVFGEIHTLSARDPLMV